MWAEAGEQEHKTVLISPASLATDEPNTIMRNFLLHYVLYIFSLLDLSCCIFRSVGDCCLLLCVGDMFQKIKKMNS